MEFCWGGISLQNLFLLFYFNLCWLAVRFDFDVTFCFMKLGAGLSNSLHGFSFDAALYLLQHYTWSSVRAWFLAKFDFRMIMVVSGSKPSLS